MKERRHHNMIHKTHREAFGRSVGEVYRNNRENGVDSKGFIPLEVELEDFERFARDKGYQLRKLGQNEQGGKMFFVQEIGEESEDVYVVPVFEFPGQGVWVVDVTYDMFTRAFFNTDNHE